MDYIIEIILGVITSGLVFVLQSVIRENRNLRKESDDNKKQRETAIETGVRQLLSVRLEEIYDQWCDSQTMPRRAYDRWMKLYSAYKGLHGNGTFEHMKEEIEEKHIINT